MWLFSWFCYDTGCYRSDNYVVYDVGCDNFDNCDINIIGIYAAKSYMVFLWTYDDYLMLSQGVASFLPS